MIGFGVVALKFASAFFIFAALLLSVLTLLVEIALAFAVFAAESPLHEQAPARRRLKITAVIE